MREPAKPAVSVVRAKEAGTPSNFFDAKRWRDHDRGIGQTIADVIHELLITDAAIGKLGARGISAHEAGQLPRNRHVTVRNPREPVGSPPRRLLVGRTDGGRALTLVIERTPEPTAWLVVTGWSPTAAERNLLDTRR
jgi:hypothetical protein